MTEILSDAPRCIRGRIPTAVILDGVLLNRTDLCAGLRGRGVKVDGQRIMADRWMTVREIIVGLIERVEALDYLRTETYRHIEAADDEPAAPTESTE